MNIGNGARFQQRHSTGDTSLYSTQGATRPKQRRASFSNSSLQRLKSLFRNDHHHQQPKQPRLSVISPPCSPKSTLFSHEQHPQRRRSILSPPTSPPRSYEEPSPQVREIRKATVDLCETYRRSNSSFRYDQKHNPRRVLTKPGTPSKNYGFDNRNSDYILYVNGSLGGKYKVLDLLGSGTFGQVAKCRNMVTGELVAVKVIKNKPAYLKQSAIEVDILKHLNHDWDPDDKHHILRMLDHFMYKHHLCLVFELLSINLYDLIKQNSFKGLSIRLIQSFTLQLLDTLVVLHNAKIIHCDLKPENILLKTLHSTKIKVIDFGSACQETNQMYSYIQSRFYRSPEVLLGLNYSAAIDMWSFGCILLELFLGLPIFPGTSEYNQLSRIVDTLGSKKAHNQVHYTFKSRKQYASEQKKQEKPSKQYFKSTQLESLIMDFPCSKKLVTQAAIDYEMSTRLLFLDFLKHILCFDPDRRMSPQEALRHPFFQHQCQHHHQHHHRHHHHHHYHQKEPALTSSSPSSQAQGPTETTKPQAPLSPGCLHPGHPDNDDLANGCICRVSKPSDNHCPNLS
ncbi:hypothetical protein [Absidia glauca]|uniref:Protein kinase domain-containing protein n=1 Tax=Absidia glauca TaxID=4829 RepID=A0A168NRI3_ABSGL|nr:hypothetical protein [Absidia glauca]